MQLCRNCGADNPIESRFCEQCGNALAGVPRGMPAESADVTAASHATPNAPSAAPLLEPVPPPAPQPYGSASHNGGAYHAPEAFAMQLGRVRLPTREQGPEPASVGVVAPWSSPMPGVPKIAGTHIALSEGERLWRSYPITHVRPFRRRAKGTLFVTDSRLVLHTASRKLSGRSLVLEEVRIESVTGLWARVSPGMGLFGIVATIAIFIFGIVQMSNGGAGAFFGLLYITIAVILCVGLYFGFGGVGLAIYTSQTTPGPVSFGYGARISRWLLWLEPLAVVPLIIGGVTATDVLLC